MQEAICHLKGWYQAALEMQAKPCYHTMEHQTSEQVDLYMRRASPGNPLPINYSPIEISNNAPSDDEIRLATSKLSNGQAAGASKMRAKHVKDWLRGVRWDEDVEGQGAPGNGDHWRLFAHLVQATRTYGIVPCQLLWIIVVLIPKGGGDYCGIGLLEPIWKVIERIINCRLDSIQLHDSLHSCCHQCRTGTTIIEAKLVQQLSYLELQPFYGVFLDFRKAFDMMDREQCLMTLEGYGAGPWMIQLICGFWWDAIMVCRAAGNYGTTFKAGRGVTRGGPLSAKLFNILVDAVVCKWVRQLKEDGDYEECELAVLTATFFAIFYVNDMYLASWNAGFLQHMLTLLVNLFQQVGLRTNTNKTQTMICTPGWIWTQLPTKSYRWMQRGRVTAAEWNSRDVQCYQCGKGMKAGSLGRHLADVHDIYQQTVVTKDLLEDHPPRNVHSQRPIEWQRPVMPLPRVRGTAPGQLNDAATLQGRAPS